LPCKPWRRIQSKASATRRQLPLFGLIYANYAKNTRFCKASPFSIGAYFDEKGTYNGSIGTYDGLIGTYNGFIGTYNDRIGACFGSIGTCFDGIGTYDGFIGTYDGAIGTVCVAFLFHRSNNGSAVLRKGSAVLLFNSRIA